MIWSNNDANTCVLFQRRVFHFHEVKTRLRLRSSQQPTALNIHLSAAKCRKEARKLSQSARPAELLAMQIKLFKGFDELSEVLANLKNERCRVRAPTEEGTSPPPKKKKRKKKFHPVLTDTRIRDSWLETNDFLWILSA